MFIAIFYFLSIFFTWYAYKRLKELDELKNIKLGSPFWDLFLFRLWFIKRNQIEDDRFHFYKRLSFIFLMIAIIIMEIKHKLILFALYSLF